MAKQQFELEYHFNTSAKVLFPRLSTADGLNEWFADRVKVDGQNYIFHWDKEEREAVLKTIKPLKTVRFHWTDDDEDDTYFEFNLSVTELTDDLALTIIDYAEPDEIDEMTEIWNAQISDLKRILGA